MTRSNIAASVAASKPLDLFSTYGFVLIKDQQQIYVGGLPQRSLGRAAEEHGRDKIVSESSLCIRDKITEQAPRVIEQLHGQAEFQ